MKRDLLNKLLLKNPVLGRKVRLLYRRFRSRSSGYSQWDHLLKTEKLFWEKQLLDSKTGPNVLLATSLGAELPVIKLESLLGVALTLRKTNIHILLCDSVLPACQLSNIWYTNQNDFLENGPQKNLCKTCFKPANKMYNKLGFTVHRYSDFLDTQDFALAEEISTTLPKEEIRGYCYEDMAIGEHATAGALRFFARGDLDNEPLGESILRKYLKSALLTTFAVKKLFSRIHFINVVMHHGIYVPQGLIGEVARKLKIPSVSWNLSYRKNTFLFSHNDTYHHTLISESVKEWENISWGPELESTLLSYLKTRWYGKNDWIKFQNDNPIINSDQIFSKLGINPSKKCIGLLTNVIWDAQLHYPKNAFPNMVDWVLKTIQYFTNRNDIQLLIRVHPAELRGLLPSRQLIVDEIKRKYPSLPKNIFIIPPESNISTYATMINCNAVIIFGTKTGVELTSLGLPVIVAGEAWIKNKGITKDAKSVDHYFSLLDQLPVSGIMDDKATLRARKYAFHFFFRRMIPLEIIKHCTGWPPFELNIKSLSNLYRGESPGLDIICNGIMARDKFIFPAEKHI